MEEDLKILQVEYLSNYWLDFPQILNFSLWDQTKTETGLKWRRPSMEDKLKVLYLSNHVQISLFFKT